MKNLVENLLIYVSCLLKFVPVPPLDPDPNNKLGVWIRTHMETFGILHDPDPHEKLCGFETLA